MYGMKKECWKLQEQNTSHTLKKNFVWVKTDFNGKIENQVKWFRFGEKFEEVTVKSLLPKTNQKCFFLIKKLHPSADIFDECYLKQTHMKNFIFF